MARERNLPELKSKGNWKNEPGSSTKKKKKPVGEGAKPKAKPARTDAGAKPRKKPDMQVKKAAAKVKSPAKNSGASRSTTGKIKKAAQNRSGDASLGQGRKSPTASKMNRMPGYSADTEKKKDKYAMRRQARTGRR